VRRPPAIPSALLRVTLPRDTFECIAGDLEEAWNAGTLSRLRYWRLALASLIAVFAARFEDRASEDSVSIRVFPRLPRRVSIRVFPRPSTSKGDGSMRTLMQDLAYGGRLMRRNPLFTAAAVVTLALGIGANTAIFSIVNVLSLQPLRYHDARRVAFVRAWIHETQSARFGLSTAEMVHLQRDASTLEQVAAYSYWSANLTGGAGPERAQAYRVTANTFDLLGVTPLYGRGFLAEEGRPGGRDVVVLSHGLWQRRFGSDPSIVGRDLILDGRPFTVVGVMPRTFEFPVFNFKGELWAPMQLDTAAILQNRVASSPAVVIARVGSGIEYATAQAEVDTIMRRLEQEYPETNTGRGARLTEMGRLDEEEAGPGIVIVMVTVAVVLLLACANVANLLLARGVTRQRELAVRAALGAGRARIVRQLLAESVLLSLFGGAAGALIAFVALDALSKVLPDIVLTTQPNLDSLGINAATLTFTLALSLATSVVFGLLPAFRAAGPMSQDGLRQGGSAGGSRGTRRLRSALVIAEVTLSTALLVVAGLLVRSYQHQQRIDTGFDPANVLAMTVTLPDYRYETPAARRQFFQQADDRIASLSGIDAAGFVNVLPFSTYNRSGGFSIEGMPPAEPGREPYAGVRIVTTGYLRAMRIPVNAGRAFDARDVPDGGRVALVNEAMVRRYFAGSDPIGGRIRLGRADSDAPLITIVGVVGDVRHEQVTERPESEIYLPMLQAPPAMMMLAARTSGDPLAYAATVRAEIQKVDPAQPVYHVKSMEVMVAEAMAPQSTAAALMTLFSGLALALAAIGIYGVIAYGVSQQRREFGVRLALGAQPRDVLALVLRSGLRLVLAGVGCGALVGLAAGQVIGSALYGIGAADPLTYAVVIALLGTVGICACCIPAWRASRTAPVSVLRLD
jgi:putative ABC transport system permease protein